MPNKQKKKFRFMQKMKGTILTILLLIILLLGVCLFAPFFNITAIEITGNEQIAGEDIIKASGLSYDVNVFKFNRFKVQKNIMKLAYIDSAKVSRKLPSTVTVSVVEAKAVLAYPYISGYAVTDISSRVLEHTDTLEEKNLIEVKGIELTNAEISTEAVTEKTVQKSIMSEIVKSLDAKQLLDKFSMIDLSDVSDIEAHMNTGLRVIFGNNENIEYKVMVLDTVFPQLEQREGAYIDLSTPSKAFTGYKEPIASDEPAAASSEPQEIAEAAQSTAEPEQKPLEDKTKAEAKSTQPPAANGYSGQGRR